MADPLILRRRRATILGAVAATFVGSLPVLSNADTTATWKGGSGGWTNATAWTGGISPGISGGTWSVLIDGGNMLASAVSLAAANANVNSLVLDAGDSITANSGGHLTTSQLSLSGTITAKSGGSFWLNGSVLNCGPSASLVADGGGISTSGGTLTLVNAQTLVLKNGGGCSLSALNTGSSTLSVPSGTSLTVGTCANAGGQIAVGGTLSINAPYMANGGSEFQLQQGGTIAFASLQNLGKTMSFAAGHVSIPSGTNGGLLQLSGTAAADTSFFNAYASTTMDNTGGTISLSGSASYQFFNNVVFSGGNLVSAGTCAFNASGEFSYMAPTLSNFTLWGTLNMGANSAISGAIVNNGTLNLNGGSTGSVTLSGTGLTVMNGGALSITSNSCQIRGAGNLAFEDNHSTIEATGVLALTGGTNDADGTLLVDSGGVLATGGAAFRSVGTILVQSGGTCHVLGNATIASIQNAGTVLLTGPNNSVNSISGGSVSCLTGSSNVNSFNLTSLDVEFDTTGFTLRTSATPPMSTAPLPPTSNFVTSALVGGYIDMTNRDLLIAFAPTNADPVSSIRTKLITGYHNGSWSAPGDSYFNGISSSFAKANHAYAIGYADGADGVVVGLAPGNVYLRCALYGDLNLDGQVNLVDLLLFEQHYGTANAAWDAGDLNYDGSVDASDFALLAKNFDQSMGGTLPYNPADQQALYDFADANGLQNLIPEPSTSLAGLISIGILGVRRVRARRKPVPMQRAPQGGTNN